MRAAVVGANGNFGLKRLRAMLHAGAEIVAVADLRLDRAREVLGDLDVQYETDYARLLKSDAEAVAIALPDHTKLAAVEDFLAAGKHVLVEKPLAVRCSDVRRLFALARANGVALRVGYNLRFFPSVEQLLRLASSGELGRIHHVRLFYGHGGVERLLAGGNWRVGGESWGGAFVDMGTHLLDLASAFVPGIERGAIERQRAFAGGVEDVCTALLSGGGVVAEVTASWTAWRSRFTAEIYGTEGFAEIEGLVKYVKYGHAGERLRHGRKAAAGAPAVVETLWSPRADPLTVIVDAVTAELEFLDHEWNWFAGSVAAGSFPIDAEEQSNLFVAEVFERLYHATDPCMQNPPHSKGARVRESLRM